MRVLQRFALVAHFTSIVGATQATGGSLAVYATHECDWAPSLIIGDDEEDENAVTKLLFIDQGMDGTISPEPAKA